MPHRSEVSLDIPNQIVTTRRYDAPRDLVWRVFTQRGHVEKWWGPVGFTTTTSEMDVRPGGLWRHVMHGPDGTDYPNCVRYSVVEPPSRLEWAHDDDSGGAPWFHCVVTFEDAPGGGTLLTLRHIFPDGAARDHNIRTYGSVQGAIDTTDRLGEQLASMTR